MAELAVPPANFNQPHENTISFYFDINLIKSKTNGDGIRQLP